MIVIERYMVFVVSELGAVGKSERMTERVTAWEESISIAKIQLNHHLIVIGHYQYY